MVLFSSFPSKQDLRVHGFAFKKEERSKEETFFLYKQLSRFTAFSPSMILPDQELPGKSEETKEESTTLTRSEIINPVCEVEESDELKDDVEREEGEEVEQRLSIGSSMRICMDIIETQQYK